MCVCVGGLCMCVCYVLFRSDDKIHCYLLVCVCVCLLEREREREGEIAKCDEISVKKRKIIRR